MDGDGPPIDDIDIIEAHGFDDQQWGPGEIDEHLFEADRVFYSVESAGETYFRWIGGPFESIDDVEAAIEDDFHIYE